MRLFYLSFLYFLATQLFFAQNLEINNLLVEGNKAFQYSDFETAKQKYESILQIDSENSDASFNLAATELNLGNTQKACALFQKSYSLGVFDSFDLIKQHCVRFEYTEKMFLDHVDELPKFIFKSEWEPLIINKKEINPKFIALLKSEIKKSKELKKMKGRIYINLNVNMDGNLRSKVGGNISQNQGIELQSILNNVTQYKPATYMGKDVGIFGGGLALPLIF